MSDNPLPDFVALWRRFDTVLSPGQRAEIRRTVSPDDLALQAAYYRVLPGGSRPSVQMRRVVFLFPHAAHREGAGNIGRLLATSRKKVSEMRLFQMIRSDDNTLALQRLRRLCAHIDAAVDWGEFGRTLYFWGNRAKRRIVEEYFASGGGK